MRHRQREDYKENKNDLADINGAFIESSLTSIKSCIRNNKKTYKFGCVM